ncbi:uncharacterized protein KQ657_004475 [Scheffersomyces spartinae]|uniref:Transcription factor IIIC 90kDa subunit N-terminal domain-containing protein n=1 Tax=Scheffersomyces spartinae TaxID=45513 RepID=A0A9P7VB96_9ASCO|nr:uncharacterized protein KQ657_004475 [Scheffersomyces spartinae]KAG7194794.1 hypothetical protein KQ657_004475 [Scheffersomyces spartinae]
MIKSITIPRINVASLIAAPVQWSDNCQVAINARTGLVVLEPKLPRVSQEVFGSKGTLLLKGLFKVSHQLDFESLKEAVDVYKRGHTAHQMEVDSTSGDNHLKQKFVFVEPLLVQHKWSPVDPVTKRCFLAVLYNTYDLIILKDDFSVHRMIENVKTFAFINYSMLSYISDAKNLVLMSLGDYNEEQDVSYELGGEEELQSEMNGEIVELSWNKDTTSLALTTSLNGVWLVHFSDSLELESGPQRLVKETRFSISKVQWVTFERAEYLIVAQTGRVSIWLLEKQQTVTTSFQNYEAIAGVYFESKNDDIILNVAFDNGLIECFTYTEQLLLPITPDKSNAIVKLVSKSLYKHQLLSKLDTSTGGKEDSVEGQFINVSTNVIFGGLLSVAYKIVPKGVINYTITSKDCMELALVRIRPLEKDIPGTTTIAQLIRFWFDKSADFPKFPNEVEELDGFVEAIGNIKQEMIGVKPEIDLDYLGSTPSQHSGLNKLQLQFNFNYSIITSVQKWLREPVISDIVSKWTTENLEIVTAIRKWLNSHILDMVTMDKLNDEYDQYIVQSISSTLGQPVTISVSNQFFTETFTANCLSPDTIALESGHLWPRCQLTQLPILEMESKTDELEINHYGVYDRITSRSLILRQLLSEIQFCLFTGNRLLLEGK